MNPEELRLRLLAAARGAPTSAPEEIPSGFEHRVMARLSGRATAFDGWLLWSRVLWKGALAACLVVGLTVLGLQVLLPASDDLADQLDAVLLADLDNGHDAP